ncbi:M18 family aminopeptidase [Propioniciclava tarda]|uniref:M18 family aminopeptidase n=1 Tax=Propioniciclava tarda TaxID=433330 RepID=UPI001159D9D7|nr:M18 family aminopeptidase [Propioniciclava tarda]SMO70558.1 aspartyl aminopeptidase [Propioniciclava tarda]
MDTIADLISFVEASPSSYHAAAEVALRLSAAGYIEQREDAPWDASPGGHFVVRDGAVVAWRVPAGEASGFRIVGAHTDSPGFKLKPRPTTGNAGWQQAGMEVYGGPLFNSWLDREFGLAGRLVLRDGRVALVSTPAWLRIPQLAPHLDRSVNDGLRLDKQAHLMPVFSVGSPGLELMSLVAKVAGVSVDDIAGHDLYAAVVERPEVFGPDGEFLASGRLDNLSSVHAGLLAILASPDASTVNVLACFDHEEVGSGSRSGAAGPLLEQVLLRIAESLGRTGDAYQRLLAASSCISADAGHAVHPNYAGLHDPDHRPLLNAGPLLKINANLRYTTDAASSAVWARACQAAGVAMQYFVSNNAVPCGSTIGPMTAERLGIVTCDVGIPLLSMHSTRELAGTRDPGWFVGALTAYYAGA